MKKTVIIILTMTICVMSVFSAFAECRWNDDEGIIAEWDSYSYKVKIELYKGSTEIASNKVSSVVCAENKESKDYTHTIIEYGPGTYTYVIRNTNGSYIDSSASIQVGDDYYTQLVLGNVKPTWQFYNGYWFLIDPLGNKLTGWHKVEEKWYYMSEGAGFCYISRLTPDGYHVDETGAWDGNPSIYQ